LNIFQGNESCTETASSSFSVLLFFEKRREEATSLTLDVLESVKEKGPKVNTKSNGAEVYTNTLYAYKIQHTQGRRCIPASPDSIVRRALETIFQNQFSASCSSSPCPPLSRRKMHAAN
jgi:hypothetical protein